MNEPRILIEIILNKIGLNSVQGSFTKFSHKKVGNDNDSSLACRVTFECVASCDLPIISRAEVVLMKMCFFIV